MKPKRLHPGVVLENGATFEGGAVFFLLITFRKKMAPPSEVAPWCQNSLMDGYKHPLEEYVFLHGM